MKLSAETTSEAESCASSVGSRKESLLQRCSRVVIVDLSVSCSFALVLLSVLLCITAIRES